MFLRALRLPQTGFSRFRSPHIKPSLLQYGLTGTERQPVPTAPRNVAILYIDVEIIAVIVKEK